MDDREAADVIPETFDQNCLYVIGWEDTTNVALWQTPEEVREFAGNGGWLCENVGWVVHQDDDCVVLAARRANDAAHHVGLAERIPRRAIIDVSRVTTT